MIMLLCCTIWCSCFYSIDDDAAAPAPCCCPCPCCCCCSLAPCCCHSCYCGWEQDWKSLFGLQISIVVKCWMVWQGRQMLRSSRPYKFAPAANLFKTLTTLGRLLQRKDITEAAGLPSIVFVLNQFRFNAQFSSQTTHSLDLRCTLKINSKECEKYDKRRF